MICHDIIVLPCVCECVRCTNLAGVLGILPRENVVALNEKKCAIWQFFSISITICVHTILKARRMINNECPKKLNDSNYRRSLLDTRRAIRSVIYSGFILSTVVLHLFGSGGAAPEWWLGKLLMFSTRISMNEFLFFTMQKTKNMNLSLNLVVFTWEISTDVLKKSNALF